MSGVVTLWDSKAYASGGGAIESKTFTKTRRHEGAVEHARRMIEEFAWNPADLVPGGLKDRAINSLKKETRTYVMKTVRYQAVGDKFEPLHVTETTFRPPLNSNP